MFQPPALQRAMSRSWQVPAYTQYSIESHGSPSPGLVAGHVDAQRMMFLCHFRSVSKQTAVSSAHVVPPSVAAVAAYWHLTATEHPDPSAGADAGQSAHVEGADGSVQRPDRHSSTDTVHPTAPLEQRPVPVHAAPRSGGERGSSHFVEGPAPPSLKEGVALSIPASGVISPASASADGSAEPAEHPPCARAKKTPTLETTATSRAKFMARAKQCTCRPTLARDQSLCRGARHGAEVVPRDAWVRVRFVPRGNGPSCSPVTSRAVLRFERGLRSAHSPTADPDTMHGRVGGRRDDRNLPRAPRPGARSSSKA